MAAAAIPYIIAAAGSAVSAMGTMAAARGQSQAYNANAEQQREIAQQAEQQSQLKAQLTEQDNARRMGAARAAFGAAGVDPNIGSPLALMADLATQGEVRRQLDLYQGRVNAYSADSQAGIYGAEADAALSAGAYGAGATLLTSASQGAEGAYKAGYL